MQWEDENEVSPEDSLITAMQCVKIAQRLETLLLHFLDWVATPWVSLISRQWRQMILSPARLDLAADVAGRAVTLDEWTFHPHLHFQLGRLCAPQSKPVRLPASDEKHRNEHHNSHSSLCKKVCIYLFSTEWFCRVAECLCRFKVLLGTSAHSQRADALPLTQRGCCCSYSGAPLTCLFSGSHWFW